MFPLSPPLLRVAQLLRIQVHAFSFECLQINPQLFERIAGNHGGQEAIQRLLRAAVGIVQQVGDGIQHGHGQGGG